MTVGTTTLPRALHLGCDTSSSVEVATVGSFHQDPCKLRAKWVGRGPLGPPHSDQDEPPSLSPLLRAANLLCVVLRVAGNGFVVNVRAQMYPNFIANSSKMFLKQ
jgi:hypothetical protein